MRTKIHEDMKCWSEEHHGFAQQKKTMFTCECHMKVNYGDELLSLLRNFLLFGCLQA